MLEEIERLKTPADLKRYIEQSEKQIEWLWRSDRPLIIAAAEQRARKLSKHAPSNATTHRSQKIKEEAK